MDCTHEAIYKGVCITCGFVINNLPLREREALLKGHTTAMLLAGASGHTAGTELVFLSESGLEKKRSENTRRLLRARRLALVLDLDHTLVHATDSISAERFAADASLDVHTVLIPPPPGVHASTLPGRYTVAIRPGSRELLQALAPLFELSVLTMGDRAYADAVVALLDPDGTLVQGRIVSRDELPDKSAKSLATLLPCDEDLVAILDDRSDVWPGLQDNVVKLAPYKFFLNASEAYDRNSAVAGEKDSKSEGLDGTKDNKTDLSNSNTVEICLSPRDNVLASLLPVFTAIHGMFYVSLPLAPKITDAILHLRQRMDVDALPVFVPSSVSNSNPISTSHHVHVQGKRVFAAAVSNTPAIRFPEDFFAPTAPLLKRRDVILALRQSVATLHLAVKESVFRGVRIAFTSTGFRGRAPEAMLEHGIARKHGATIVPLPDFKNFVAKDMEENGTGVGTSTDSKAHIHIRAHAAWDWEAIPTHVISVSTTSPEALLVAEFNSYCQAHRITGPTPKNKVSAGGVCGETYPNTFSICEVDPSWIIASATHFIRQPEELFVPHRPNAVKWMSRQVSWPITKEVETGIAQDPLNISNISYGMSETDAVYVFQTRTQLLLANEDNKRSKEGGLEEEEDRKISTSHHERAVSKMPTVFVSLGSLKKDYLEAAEKRKWKEIIRHAPYAHSVGSLVADITMVLRSKGFLTPKEEKAWSFGQTADDDGDGEENVVDDDDSDDNEDDADDFDEEEMYRQYQEANAAMQAVVDGVEDEGNNNDAITDEIVTDPPNKKVKYPLNGDLNDDTNEKAENEDGLGDDGFGDFF